MSKLPTVTERFRVMCSREVTAAELGATIAAMTRAGFTDVHFELIEEVHAFQKNQKRTQTAPLLVAWVEQHPTFKSGEVVEYLGGLGLTPTGAHSALARLVAKKIVRKLGDGNYSLATVKHLAAPKKKTTKATRTKKKQVATGNRFDRPGYEVVLSYARRNHGRFNSEKMREVFVAEGRSTSSASVSIDYLLKKKMVKRVGPGSYMLLVKGTNHAPKPKVNSGVEPVAAEVANVG